MMSTVTKLRRDENDFIRGTMDKMAGGGEWEKFTFICNETSVSKGHCDL